jgi:antitoxin component YwqK of YwqJK toxin-antitoxin module
MKHKLSFLYLLLLTYSSILAQPNDTIFYKEGNIATIIKKSGNDNEYLITSLHKNGKLSMEVTCLKDRNRHYKPISDFKVSYPSGKKQLDFDSDKGIFKFYTEDGKLSKEIVYPEKDTIETEITYYLNGNKKEIIIQRKDKDKFDYFVEYASNSLLMPRVGKGYNNQHYAETGFYPNGKKYYFEELKKINGNNLSHRTFYLENGSVDTTTRSFPFFEGKNFKYFSKEGTWKKWWDNGNLLMEEKYKDNKLHGSWVRFYETGELLGRTHYNKGNRDSVQVTYFKDGRIRDYIMFTDLFGSEKYYGPKIDFYPRGKLRQLAHSNFMESTSEDWSITFDTITGLVSKFYFPAMGAYYDGTEKNKPQRFKVNQEGNQYDLKKITISYANGKPLCSLNFNDLIAEGKLIFYDTTGKLSSERSYQHGFIDGRFISLSKKGDTLAINNYAKGMYSGLQVYNNNDGTKRSADLFDNKGNLLYQVYNYKNGRLKLKREEIKDVLVTTEYFDDSDKIYALYKKTEDNEMIRETNTRYFPGGEVEVMTKVEVKKGSKSILTRLETEETYYENKQLKSKINRVNHKPDGECIGYFPDGKTNYIQHYNAGMKNGEFLIYDEKGNKISREKYADGKLVDSDKAKINTSSACYCDYSLPAEIGGFTNMLSSYVNMSAVISSGLFKLDTAINRTFFVPYNNGSTNKVLNGKLITYRELKARVSPNKSFEINLTPCHRSKAKYELLIDAKKESFSDKFQNIEAPDNFNVNNPLHMFIIMMQTHNTDENNEVLDKINYFTGTQNGFNKFIKNKYQLDYGMQVLTPENYTKIRGQIDQYYYKNPPYYKKPPGQNEKNLFMLAYYEALFDYFLKAEGTDNGFSNLKKFFERDPNYKFSNYGELQALMTYGDVDIRLTDLVFSIDIAEKILKPVDEQLNPIPGNSGNSYFRIRAKELRYTSLPYEKIVLNRATQEPGCGVWLELLNKSFYVLPITYEFDGDLRGIPDKTVIGYGKTDIPLYNSDNYPFHLKEQNSITQGKFYQPDVFLKNYMGLVINDASVKFKSKNKKWFTGRMTDMLIGSGEVDGILDFSDSEFEKNYSFKDLKDDLIAHGFTIKDFPRAEGKTEATQFKFYFQIKCNL